MPFQLSAASPLGIASYNAFDFGGSAKTTGFSVKPIRDRADRTTIAHEYLLTIQFYIEAGTNETIDDMDLGTDFDGNTINGLNGLRFALMKEGKPFAFRDRGISDLVIGTQNGDDELVTDIKWGPVPQMFSPAINGLVSALITWQVKFVIAPCAFAQDSDGFFNEKLMAYNFTVAFAVDDHGYTTRTVRGYLEIPMIRLDGSRVLSDVLGNPTSADDYLESIEPDCPDGFRPVSRTWDIDESKSHLNFTFVHAQMPTNAYPPPGVVECTAEHSTENTDAFTFLKWQGTISASYSFPPDTDPSIAYQYFADLVNDRLDKIRDEIDSQGNGVQDNCVMVAKVRVTEPEIYGRRGASFSASYTATGTVAQIFTTSLWTEVPNSDYDMWKDSLSGSVFAVRGQAGLTFNPRTDVITDLCIGNPVTLKTPDNPEINTLQGMIASFATPQPSPAASWLHYENHLIHETGSGTAAFRSLPMNTSTPQTEDDPLFNSTTGFSVTNRVDQGKVTVQNRVRDGYYAILEGQAARVSYPINPPELTNVGNVKPVPADRPGQEFFRYWTKGGLQTIFMAEWRKRWFVPGTPQGQIGAPPTPFSIPTGDESSKGGGDTTIFADGDPDPGDDGAGGG